MRCFMESITGCAGECCEGYNSEREKKRKRKACMTGWDAGHDGREKKNEEFFWGKLPRVGQEHKRDVQREERGVGGRDVWRGRTTGKGGFSENCRENRKILIQREEVLKRWEEYVAEL